MLLYIFSVVYCRTQAASYCSVVLQVRIVSKRRVDFTASVQTGSSPMEGRKRYDGMLPRLANETFIESTVSHSQVPPINQAPPASKRGISYVRHLKVNA